MGVKSTITLSRDEALEKYVALMKMSDERIRRQLEAEATAMLDKDLEDVLERLNDFVHDGEGYENYLIRS